MFLQGLAAATLGGAGLLGYAVGLEPFRLRVRAWKVSPDGWPAGLDLRIVVLADIHTSEPWMPARRVRGIVERANALDPDIVLLLGDYVSQHRWSTGEVPAEDWSRALARLTAPLGVHAILGNHDWWDDDEAQRRGHGPVAAGLALESSGIPVYENDVRKLQKDGESFWLAGLGDQRAVRPGGIRGRGRWRGVDDLPGTLARVTDDAPVILMAHEPDIYPVVPDRVALTLSGHTHGGQVRILGYSPVVPSRFGNRYAYGHVIESGERAGARPRHLIVSGGLGISILPVRFGVPPEITVIEVGAA